MFSPKKRKKNNTSHTHKIITKTMNLPSYQDILTVSYLPKHSVHVLHVPPILSYVMRSNEKKDHHQNLRKKQFDLHIRYLHKPHTSRNVQEWIRKTNQIGLITVKSLPT